MDNAMDLVHENSVSAIALLQNSFKQQKDIMFLVSVLFDPRYAFLFYAPLLYSLDRYTGRKLMWVAVISEWSNQVLKWILHGERPYWWVHETQVYNRSGIIQIPAVEQFSVTCETGPGSPSGHAMVTASVWYILIEALLRQRGTLNKQSIVNSILWSVYTIILCVVSLSRVYIAAHFPHQCLLGMVIGVAVAMIVSNLDTDRFKKSDYIKGTGFLLSTAMATYVILKAAGINPMWSLDRALKWCAKQEYIHLDTTPFFSMMRYSGFFLGMGFGFHSPLYDSASKVRFTTGMKVLSAILSLAISKGSEYIKIPMFNIYAFYAMAFLISAVLPYVFIAVVPFIVSKIWSQKGMEKAKVY